MIIRQHLTPKALRVSLVKYNNSYRNSFEQPYKNNQVSLLDVRPKSSSKIKVKRKPNQPGRPEPGRDNKGNMDD